MPDPFAQMTNAGGAGTQVPTRLTPPVPSIPAGPLASRIATAGVPVTVFAAGTIVNVADIINPSTASEPLYVDLVGPALAGAPTSVPLLPGQAYRVSAPICTPVTAVAATAGHAFVAVSY
jgi:hypothetical protein